MSILPIISKKFEKLLCKQVTFFVDPVPSNFQRGFRKGFGTQDCLLAMLGLWKSDDDKNKCLGHFLQIS